MVVAFSVTPPRGKVAARVALRKRAAEKSADKLRPVRDGTYIMVVAGIYLRGRSKNLLEQNKRKEKII